jgi:DNA-directed RNA polymerase specialized sigma24 family protein
MAAELRRTFNTVFESLPNPYREVIALSEFQGLHVDEIGSALGITAPQARIGLFHARRAMTQRLAERMRAGR